MQEDSFTADDAMCVLALAAAGVHVSTTLDLVGVPPNEEALRVLCRLLPRATSPLLREAIVSILSVRQAKGLACECLLQEFRRVDEADAQAPGRRRSVAFGIAVVATDRDFYSILDLLHDDSLPAECRVPLVFALGAMDSLAQPASRVVLETLESQDLARWGGDGA